MWLKHLVEPFRYALVNISGSFVLARYAIEAYQKGAVRHIKTIASIWPVNMLGYLSADIICSEKRTVFRERSSRKTVSFEEQIMSKDKYASIFSPQMEAIVFIILQIFFATRSVLKLRGYINNSRHFRKNMLGYLSADIICSEEKCELRGTDNVQGQISEHIFSPTGGYCFQIFFATRAVLKMGGYSRISPSFSWVISVT